MNQLLNESWIYKEWITKGKNEYIKNELLNKRMNI